MSVELYKICEHKGRDRDRCEHAWWACFRGHRVSLDKWAPYDVHNKSEAHRAFDDLKAQIRAGTFNKKPEQHEPAPGLTFEKLTPLYLRPKAEAGAEARRAAALA